MGEIAEDMTDGTSCALCGVYFTETHDYPVLCKDCWRESWKRHQAGQQRSPKQLGYQKAQHPEAK